MITLKFPSLEKALMKADKDWNNDNPRKGIIVINDCAMVIADHYCFVIDLYEYFTLECGIHEDEDLQELRKILFFMNQKIFFPDFWKEITKGANMKMENGSLYVENPKYSKVLHYKMIKVDLLEPLSSLQKSIKQSENVVSSIGIPFIALQKIYSIMASDFKDDILILEFVGQDRMVKFTFRKRKHCFGYIKPNYDSVQEGFRFENFQHFINDESVVELIEDLEKEAYTPLPPSDDKDFFDDNDTNTDLE